MPFKPIYLRLNDEREDPLKNNSQKGNGIIPQTSLDLGPIYSTNEAFSSREVSPEFSNNKEDFVVSISSADSPVISECLEN